MEKTSQPPMSTDVAPAPVLQVDQSQKKRHGCLRFFIVVVVLFLAFLSWFVWTVASTGFIKIPLITPIAFELPVPDHVVEPVEVNIETLIAKQVTSELTKRLYANNGVLEDRSISIHVTENMLTYSLQSVGEVVSVTDGISIDLSTSQVAIVGDQLELYIPVSGQDTAFVFAVKPKVSDGGFSVDLDSLAIGQWNIPRFLVRGVINRAIDFGIKDANNSIQQFIELEKILVQEDGVYVLGEFVADITDLTR
ncbi:MAG: hypothetical protein O2877_01115 [bacterium]|nr:hypothetical protein [bacterium]